MAYRAALEDSVLDPEILKITLLSLFSLLFMEQGSDIYAIQRLWDHGVEVAVVDEQNQQDPNFSTVKSPNQKTQEALKKGISVAQKTKSDAVLGKRP